MDTDDEGGNTATAASTFPLRLMLTPSSAPSSWSFFFIVSELVSIARSEELVVEHSALLFPVAAKSVVSLGERARLMIIGPGVLICPTACIESSSYAKIVGVLLPTKNVFPAMPVPSVLPEAEFGACGGIAPDVFPEPPPQPAKNPTHNRIPARRKNMIEPHTEERLMLQP